MDFTTKRAKVLAVGAVAGVAAALTVGLSAPSGATPVASRGGGGDHVRLDRVFIIVLENQNQEDAIRDPYLKKLAAEGANNAEAPSISPATNPPFVLHECTGRGPVHDLRKPVTSSPCSAGIVRRSPD